MTSVPLPTACGNAEFRHHCYTLAVERVAQVSRRGTITLPVDVRRELGLAEGDVLAVTVEAGRIVLSPAVITPIELYTEARLREFSAGGEMTEAEVAAARRRWARARRPSRGH